MSHNGTVSATLCVLLVASALAVGAQQPLQSVTGVVRDPNELPLDAQVTVGEKHTLTDSKGAFRVDSLPPGRYPMTVRALGFSPLHSFVTVVATEPTALELYLTPAAVRLPVTIVEGRRSGIFGTVGDTAYRIASGARVQLLGPHRAEVITDSLGKFAFPEAARGQYVIRVTYPRYTERRILIDLSDGEGRDLAVLLAPANEPTTNAAEAAFRDLGLRLGMSLKRDRLTAYEMERFGGQSVCDMAQIKSEIGSSTIFLLNGTTIYREMPLEGLCGWKVDEVELVEFGNNVCAERTHTVADVLNIYCGPVGGRGPTSINPAGSRGIAAKQSYVVIWEKK